MSAPTVLVLIGALALVLRLLLPASRRAALWWLGLLLAGVTFIGFGLVMTDRGLSLGLGIACLAFVLLPAVALAARRFRLGGHAPRDRQDV